MRIAICGSMSFTRLMVRSRDVLVGLGHQVVLPQGAEEHLDDDYCVRTEGARDKRQQDLIRVHYEKIKDAEAILVINPPKDGLDGYIGGNTLIEMAFAHVLGKRIFLLYPPARQLGYIDEIEAMPHTVLDGDPARISRKEGD